MRLSVCQPRTSTLSIPSLLVVWLSTAGHFTHQARARRQQGSNASYTYLCDIEYSWHHCHTVKVKIECWTEQQVNSVLREHVHYPTDCCDLRGNVCCLVGRRHVSNHIRQFPAAFLVWKNVLELCRVTGTRKTMIHN